MRCNFVGMRFDLERGQGFSELFAFGKRRSPVVVVTAAVKADGFADQQGVGDQGDGHFGERLQGTVGAGDVDFEDRLGHVFHFAWVHRTDYRRGMCSRVDKEMQRSLQLSLMEELRVRQAPSAGLGSGLTAILNHPRCAQSPRGSAARRPRHATERSVTNCAFAPTAFRTAPRPARARRP